MITVLSSGNLSNVEKQEIKTVRIVKRESERRQRDRERSLQPMSDWSTNITANLDQFLEEELVQPINNYRASSLPRTDYKYEDYYKQNDYRQERNLESPKYPSSPSLSNYDYSRDISSLSSSYNRNYKHERSLSNQYMNSPTDSSRTLTNMSKTSSIISLTRSNMELSPIFKSEAAKQIVTEMNDNGSMHRRQVPREKRRHNTAPHHLSAKTLNELPKDGYNQDVSYRELYKTFRNLVVFFIINLLYKRLRYRYRVASLCVLVEIKLILRNNINSNYILLAYFYMIKKSKAVSNKNDTSYNIFHETFSLNYPNTTQIIQFNPAPIQPIYFKTHDNQ